MKTSIHLFLLVSTTTITALPDPKSITHSKKRKSARLLRQKKIPRKLLTRPLVVPNSVDSFKCYIDELFGDYGCYDSHHDYTQSHFVALCATKMFDANSCTCELSTQPDSDHGGGTTQQGSFSYRLCASCGISATKSGQWAVRYDCSNLLSGDYATYESNDDISTKDNDNLNEDSVSLDEESAAPPFSIADLNLGLTLVEDIVLPPKVTVDETVTQDSSVAEFEHSSPAPSGGVTLTIYQATHPPNRAPVLAPNNDNR